MSKLEDIILDYLRSITTMQVATCSNDKPWCCNVYFSSDLEFNLYFISRPTRQHSEQIRNNKFVAVSLCREHHHPFEMPNRGIQASGSCIEIAPDSDSFSQKKSIYLQRFPASSQFFDSHYIYQIALNKIVLFDEVNYREDPWQTLELSQLQE